MAERSFAKEVEQLRIGAGQEFRGEGILAVTKALLQSGVGYVGGYQGAPDFPSHGRPLRRARYPRRAGRPFRGERQRGHGRRDARRERPLPDPRRGHLEGHGRNQRRFRRARQPRLGRGEGRRHDHRRRGLWRRLLDHAGAEPCLRHEVADLAPRPAAQPRDHRQARRGRLRAVGSLEHAGDARDPHPHLSPPRPLHRQGQQAPGLHREGCVGEAGARHQPHRAAARLLPPRAGEDQFPSAGRDQVHPGAEAQRGVRSARTAMSASSCRAACTMASSALWSASALPTSGATRRSRSTSSMSPTR